MYMKKVILSWLMNSIMVKPETFDQIWLMSLYNAFNIVLHILPYASFVTNKYFFWSFYSNP